MPFIWSSVKCEALVPAKRALLIISDGGDNSSCSSEKDIKRLVREAEASLSIVLERQRNSTDPTLLNEMTELTGACAFAVKNLDDLPDIAAKIGAELHNQYVRGYHRAIAPATPAGARSRSNCGLPRVFPLSAFTQEQATTRLPA
jgi:hypothetical protein